jgi:hypothetical protein
MSKKDAYNFLSGISLTNVPRNKNALRESQINVLPSSKEKPSSKPLRYGRRFVKT